jgi:hypothetical protein
MSASPSELNFTGSSKASFRTTSKRGMARGDTGAPGKFIPCGSPSISGEVNGVIQKSSPEKVLHPDFMRFFFRV